MAAMAAVCCCWCCCCLLLLLQCSETVSTQLCAHADGVVLCCVSVIRLHLTRARGFTVGFPNHTADTSAGLCGIGFCVCVQLSSVGPQCMCKACASQQRLFFHCKHPCMSGPSYVAGLRGV
ncbi:hypothetical protein COO60DRAFT_1519095 [Scenedesmus sp. NREL 46B-D3]|nr:hypothetical protein COO60DRAFT_1519095 [Scenedesmus sp. NREL 46B-D3]